MQIQRGLYSGSVSELPEGAILNMLTRNLTQEGRKILAAQPFSTFLGAELTRLSPGSVELRLAVRDELRQHYGFVHGGVVSYLADSALSFAGGSVFANTPIVTSEFKINYIRPSVGDMLIARAEVIGQGRKQAVVRCDIFAVTAGVEKLCAAAQGTIVILPDPKL